MISPYAPWHSIVGASGQDFNCSWQMKVWKCGSDKGLSSHLGHVISSLHEYVGRSLAKVHDRDTLINFGSRRCPFDKCQEPNEDHSSPRGVVEDFNLSLHIRLPWKQFCQHRQVVVRSVKSKSFSQLRPSKNMSAVTSER